MSLNPLIVVGVGTLIGAAGTIGFNVVRSRREARRAARREQLIALARRSGLEYVGDRPRLEDQEQARWYRGAEREAPAEGFLQGQDRQGRYWMARRKVMGQVQEVLGFQIRGDLGVGRAYIEPVLSAPANGGTSWMKRCFSRPAPVSTSVVSWTVHREATTRQVEDENARNSMDRWVAKLVARGKSESRVPVGLEVRDGLGWVFSTRPMDGMRMREFLDLALDLRGIVLHEVQRRPATISTAVNTVTGQEELRARASTAPMFAVDVAEGADIDEHSKTVVLSAEDLLREAPTPSRKRRSKRFEIPEPDEEVEVIGTWGR